VFRGGGLASCGLHRAGTHVTRIYTRMTRMYTLMAAALICMLVESSSGTVQVLLLNLHSYH
jgi:hypothetical protein